MQTSESPVLKDIVLVGGGHSHVGVLKSFGMQPMPGVRLTLICTDIDTPYSGMLPGYVAGHYSFDAVHIDLGRLAAFAKARLYHDEVIGIDRSTRRVLCRNRPPVPFDVLSVNTGATPQLQRVPGASAHAMAVKPIAQFNQRWLALLARFQAHPGKTTVAVVGAGAGGVELLLAMQHRLRKVLSEQGRNPDALEFHLMTQATDILPTHNAWVRRHFMQVLKARGVQVHTGSAVVQVGADRLQTTSGQTLLADEIVWVTDACGAAWLKDTGLALDAKGFIEVKDTLQSVSDPAIFAAGDAASMVNFKLEKAGVFAVRQAKPLTHNLRLSVQGLPIKPYHPQRRWLALISTGDRHAVASRGALGFAGAWVWRWKDWIDRRFMQRFSQFPAMDANTTPTTGTALSSEATDLQLTPAESLQAISAIAMRCGGCGAKVGATVLANALGQLQPFQNDDVLIGLKDPDDAAVVRVPPGKALVHSVDFFRSFIDDPYVFGQVAANHALGDIWAMGAEPQSATAIATVPPGLESKVEDVLFQMMSGALLVLNAARCALVGGHTGEGRELALGFAINGLIDDDPAHIMRKSGMQPGDVLILTKPIGTGTLFAAHARLFAKGRWVDAALASMVVSNQNGAACLREFGASACTDLTGFGLLGHLLEMTRPSGVDAEISLSALPVLDGAQACVEAGIVSSLQSANVRLRRAVRHAAVATKHPRYPLVFDPQTAGGLLASVPPDRAQACVQALRARGYPHTAIIGRVLAQGDALEPIVLLD
jgi:selenide, water dikinase